MAKKFKVSRPVAEAAPEKEVVKSVDQMIEDHPAHTGSANREYLRQLIKGQVREDWQKGGR